MRLNLSTGRRIVAIALVLVWPSIVSAQSSKRSAALAEKVLVQKVVDGHNKERAKEGLPPLTLEDKLTEAAKAHAQDMAEQEVMTHDGSDGSHPAERVTRAGYRYRSTGENVAKGYRTVPEVMKAWMESPPHKKNILGDYSEIGVALVYGKDERAYWCVEFGKPFPQFQPGVAATDLVEKINEEREVAKLPLMTVDPKLSKAAQEKADKLAKVESRGGGTASSDGLDPKDFPETAVSTASGHPDADSMMKALLESPQLKEQILGKYTKIGAGYAVSKDGTPYWSLILANPPPRTSPRRKSR
jgi:uncharacterized protein YkwD